MTYRCRFLMLIFVIICCGCQPHSTTPPSPSAAADKTSASDLREQQGFLRMTINGKLWEADGPLTAIHDAPIAPKALIINGMRGPRDASQQDFTMNLYGITTAGKLHIDSEDAHGSVVQLTNADSEDFLVGAMMGYALDIDVLSLGESRNDWIELRFSGALKGNSGREFKITDGWFRTRKQN